MPSQTLRIEKFTGLNTRDVPGRLADTELMECQNFEVGLHGELFQRTGIKRLATIAAGKTVTLLGHFKTATYDQILARVDNEIYWSSDGTTWHLIAGGPFNDTQYAVQYVDNFYIVRHGANILSWDGAAMSALANTPSGTAAGIFKDRLFVVDSLGSNPSRVYYSEVGDFTDFLALGQFLDVNPGDGDVVVAFAILQSNFFIFKMFSTWILYTTTDITAWQLRNISPEIGCISKWTIKDIEGSLYFLGPLGVYKTDGYFFTEISILVQPTFRKQIADVSQLNQSCAAFWEDKYMVTLVTFDQATTWGSLRSKTWSSLKNTPWGFSTNATRTWFVFNVRNNAWTHWLPAPAENMGPSNFCEVKTVSGLRGLYIGSWKADGKVFKYGDSGYTDGLGSIYECVFETKEFDLDTPYAKRGMQLTVEADGDGSYNATNIVDGDEQAIQKISFYAGRQVVPSFGPEFFHQWRLRFSGLPPTWGSLSGETWGELSGTPWNFGVGTGSLIIYGVALSFKTRQKLLAGR